MKQNGFLGDADAISLKSLEVLKHEEELAVPELQDLSCAKACPTPALLSVEVRLEATRVPCGSIMNLLNGLGVNGFHPEPEEWRAGMETAGKLTVYYRKRKRGKQSLPEW